MKLNLYVIFDKVAEESGPIFQAVNDGIALRQTVQVLKPLPPHVRPEYSLIHVGEFDTKTMDIFVLPPREVDFTLAVARSDEYAVVEVNNE